MKRGVKLAILALALALLALGALAARHMGEERQVSETEGSYALGVPADDLAALSWTDKDGKDWRFERQADVWVNAQDAAFPVDQSTLDALAGRIEELTATRELSGAAEAADYGLAEPSFTVTATDTNGNDTLYAQGDATPFADGYYVQVSGRDAIYTVATSLASAFDKTLSELAAMEGLPEVENVTRIAVGEALDATLGEDGAWRDATAGEALDGEAVAALVDGVKALAFSGLVETSPTDEELTAYGLADAATRVTLYDGDEEALTLLLGAEDGEGNRYAQLPGSGRVYTIYGGDVEDLLAASPQTLWSRDAVAQPLASLTEATFTWNGGEATLTRAPAQAAETLQETEDAPEGGEAEDDGAADGEAEDGATYALNGAALDAGAASDLWERATGLQGTERVQETAKGESVLTIAWTAEDGATGVAAFYPRDVDSYLMPVSQESAMLVPADDVDRLARALRLLVQE